jgi:hypothetical protein
MIMASLGLYLAVSGHDHETVRPEGASYGPAEAGTAPAATKAFQSSSRKYLLVIAS